MRFVRFDGDRLGLHDPETDGIVDLTDRLGLDGADPLEQFIRQGLDASEYADADPDHDLADVTLESPVEWPRKVVAAPSNYAEHIAEMSGSDIRPCSYFLKAPSSIVGPSGTIELPFNDRRCDHEVELAFVMADDVRDLDRDDLLDHVFGFTILLDISVRGNEDRSNRKSYDSFTVIGPAVVTPDEIADLDDLDLRLWVNHDLRQDSNTEHLIYSCGEIVEWASHNATIHAGDVVTTGTPSGVGPLTDGDTVEAEITDVGRLSLDVAERDVSYEDVKIHKGQ